METISEDAMTSERTQKIADSILLRAVARVSMAMALPVIGIIVTLGSAWLNDQFEKQAIANKSQFEKQAIDSQNAISTQITRIDRIEKTATTAIEQSAKVNDRLTVVETKQVTADATAANFQKDTLIRLDRLQDSMVSMSNAIAALTATMQAREDYDRRRSTNPP